MPERKFGFRGSGPFLVTGNEVKVIYRNVFQVGLFKWLLALAKWLYPSVPIELPFLWVINCAISIRTRAKADCFFVTEN